MNIYHDKEIQTNKKKGNITTRLYLDYLITFSPLNNLNIREHQPDLFDLFLTRERMDSEEETYLSYKEMLLEKLDLYYFRLD